MVTASFLGSASSKILAGQPSLLGCPLDFTSTFRSGSNKSTAAIREASESIETYSPLLEMDLEDLSFSDLGDLDFTGDSIESAITKIERHVSLILDGKGLPFIFGGEHTITLGCLQAFIRKFPDLQLIHLDAHTDLRDEYEGQTLNHSTVIRRIAELMGPERITQLGIRSGTRDEFLWMKEHHTLMQWEPGSEKLLLQKIAHDPVYITLDLDVFDPSCLPGTGNPEGGGWFYTDFQRFIRTIRHFHIVGMDVLELNPNLDQSGASGILAAKVVREMLLVLSQSTGAR